ncbi:BCCT family transporter [Brachyspira alvinipulli]|uniref:BCCT family transporter n=1 Tax=Brachyspira alvinipulli TaxID=84379 RepID=UPI003004A497
MENNNFEDNRYKIDFIIKLASSIIVVLIVLLALFFKEATSDVINYIRTLVTKYLNWYFVLLASILLIFSIWLTLGRYSKVVLGGKDAKPEFNRFAWYSMLYACGQGVGMIFWGVAEPIMFFDSGKFATARSLENIGHAMNWTYFHWGIHAWVIYCIASICMAYSFHNSKKPLTYRDTVLELFPEKTRNVLAIVVETVAILTTVLGLSTSFGFAIVQFASGLENLFNIKITLLHHIIIIVSLAVIVGLEMSTGIHRGIKIVSETNTILSLVLLAFVFLFGPTIFILSLFVESLGSYLFNLFPMGFYTDSTSMIEGFIKWQDSWSGWWTVFIWCWTFAFASFTGGFVARISKGRTIRDFMIGVILVPSLFVIIWSCIMGGSAIYYDIKSSGAIAAAVAVDNSSGIFAMFKNMNIGILANFATIMATVLVATYYISSLDSGIIVLSDYVSSKKHPSNKFKIVLLILVTSIALVLFTVGGAYALTTVQIAAIIAGVPFSFLMIFMCINLVKRLKKDNS